MAGAGPDRMVFGLYESRHSQTVMACIVLMFLAMEVDVTLRSLSILMVFPSQLENAVCFILLGL